MGGVWDLDDDLDLDSELGCYEDPSYFQQLSPAITPRKAAALPQPRFSFSAGTSVVLPASRAHNKQGLGLAPIEPSPAPAPSPYHPCRDFRP